MISIGVEGGVGNMRIVGGLILKVVELIVVLVSVIGLFIFVKEINIWLFKYKIFN